MLARCRRNIEVQSVPLISLARRVIQCCVAFFFAFVAFPVWADPGTERQAQVLQKKAIEEDSLNVAYPAAIKKLATAISKCGTDKCSPSLRGALYRDLGAMLILSGTVDDGRAAFAKALGLDPSLDLDPAYKSPMLEGLWIDTKKKGVTGPTAGEPAQAGGAASAGDFAHVPAGAQLVRTPLPIYVEYVGTEKLLRVVVKYRGTGMTDWKPLELRKMETGYGGLIPCKDVGEGTMQYYVQGYGTSDDPVATSGGRNKPYNVPIKHEITGLGPSLPGQEPPRQCAESAATSDCPPDFPGCHVQKKGGGEDCKKNGDCESGLCTDDKCVEKKAEGEDCAQDSECSSGSCSDDKCAASKKAADETCDTDDECSSGTCQNGKCTSDVGSKKQKSKASHKVWVGLAISIDFTSLPAATDVCKLQKNATTGVVTPLNGAGYQCNDPSTGANFPGTNGALNDQIATGSLAHGGDAISGGLTPGNVRLMATFDYALGTNILLGARAGFVVPTDPAQSPGAAFPPIHVEARGTYLFGADPLAASIAPMLFVAAGISEFDAKFGIQVLLLNGKLNNEDAWRTAGPIFGAVGAGARIRVGKNIALTAALKGELAFGGSAGSMLAIAPEVGAQLGL